MFKKTGSEKIRINTGEINEPMCLIIDLMGFVGTGVSAKQADRDAYQRMKGLVIKMKLQLENIHKNYGETEVLKGVTIEAEGGRALGLLGRNGAGKTTCIRIILGILQSTDGQVLLDGKPMNRNQYKIGYLPEEHGLYPKIKLMDQLVFFARLRGMGRADAQKAVEYWIGRMELSEWLNKKLSTLSKGNQQKVQVACAMLTDPDILILDEPFSGLDPVNAQVLKEIIREEVAKEKIVFFSSHQMNYVEEFCEHIAILNGGHIALNGSIQDIRRTYDRRGILINGAGIGSAQDLLKGKPYVSQLSGGNDELLVHLEKASDISSLYGDLAVSNLAIDSVKVDLPSLEDIFVEYTEEKGA